MLLGQNVKNGLINANFPIWQRNTSFNLAVDNYVADRTRCVKAADGGTLAAGTVSRQSFSPGEFEDQSYFLRITNTSQGSSLGPYSYHGLDQPIEDVRTFAGKRVTFSIWARSTIPNKVMNVSCFQYFGSGGSASVSPQGSQITILDNIIRRYNVTIDVPSVSGKILGTSHHTNFWITAQDGASHAALFGLPGISWQGTGNIDIIRWQVNEGGIADFETAGRSLSEEIILCQRFYEKSYRPGVYPGTATSDGTSGLRAITGAPWIPQRYAVIKRVVPLVRLYDWAGAVDRIRTNGSNGVVLNGSINGSEGSFEVVHATSVSEIFYQWTSDAEL